MFLFGLFLVTVKVSQEFFGLGGRQVTLWGLVVGLVMAGAGPITIWNLARTYWAKHRLVLGFDRLQIVEHRNGEDVVLLQIPYANIAYVGYDLEQGRAGIDLKSIDDPDTLGGDDVDFQVFKEHLGRHYSITYGYHDGPEAIAEEIHFAIQKWAATVGHIEL